MGNHYNGLFLCQLLYCIHQIRLILRGYIGSCFIIYGYVRIKDITLGYTLPQRWLRKIFVKDLRLSATLSDFFTFSHSPKGWDPEVSSTGYPITKSVIFTASIKF